jgi:Mrp family chromosome partitioning ATPase
MKELLGMLKQQYDSILIDTPPVLPLSDMSIFRQMVDGIVLVVRAEHTPRHAIEDAVEELGTDKLIGFVLNGGRRKLMRYHNTSDKREKRVHA